MGNPRTKKLIVLGILTQSKKKAVCISSYYDKLPLCKISKANESPLQRYARDGRTDGRTDVLTDECEFIGHRFVKPVTN